MFAKGVFCFLPWLGLPFFHARVFYFSGALMTGIVKLAIIGIVIGGVSGVNPLEKSVKHIQSVAIATHGRESAVYHKHDISLTGLPLKDTVITGNENTPRKVASADKPIFHYVDAQLWEYVRQGLSYLESPLASFPPEAVDPTYLHPDKKGYGAYGFTPAAYADVQRNYAFFKAVTWEEMLSSQALYDLANRAFADLLLTHLQDFIDPQASYVEKFAVLHQAWNLGLSGFKSGRHVVVSRLKRADAFISAHPAI
jgi:hypothetical protein